MQRQGSNELKLKVTGLHCGIRTVASSAPLKDVLVLSAKELALNYSGTTFRVSWRHVKHLEYSVGKRANMIFLTVTPECGNQIALTLVPKDEHHLIADEFSPASDRRSLRYLTIDLEGSQTMRLGQKLGRCFAEIQQFSMLNTSFSQIPEHQAADLIATVHKEWINLLSQRKQQQRKAAREAAALAAQAQTSATYTNPVSSRLYNNNAVVDNNTNTNTSFPISLHHQPRYASLVASPPLQPSTSRLAVNDRAVRSISYVHPEPRAPQPIQIRAHNNNNSQIRTQSLNASQQKQVVDVMLGSRPMVLVKDQHTPSVLVPVSGTATLRPATVVPNGTRLVTYQPPSLATTSTTAVSTTTSTPSRGVITPASASTADQRVSMSMSHDIVASTSTATPQPQSSPMKHQLDQSRTSKFASMTSADNNTPTTSTMQQPQQRVVYKIQLPPSGTLIPGAGATRIVSVTTNGLIRSATKLPTNSTQQTARTVLPRVAKRRVIEAVIDDDDETDTKTESTNLADGPPKSKKTKYLLMPPDTNEEGDDKQEPQQTAPHPLTDDSRLFTYKRITAYVRDLAGLEEREFLNDTVIDFYLQYLVCELLPEPRRSTVHVFNSYFWTAFNNNQPSGNQKQSTANSTTFMKAFEKLVGIALSPKQKKDVALCQQRYDAVKRWTKNVDIFEKEFVLVPINNESHWFLALICYPNSLSGVITPAQITIRSDSSTPSPRTKQPSKTTQRIDTSNPPSCIIVFDSLLSTPKEHYRVVASLRNYLIFEWLNKRGLNTQPAYHIDQKAFKGIYPRPLQQDNYWDCGVFLLQYAERFLLSPPTRIDKQTFEEKTWIPPEKVADKRKQIIDLMLDCAKNFSNITVIVDETAKTKQVVSPPKSEAQTSSNKDDEKPDAAVSTSSSSSAANVKTAPPASDQDSDVTNTSTDVLVGDAYESYLYPTQELEKSDSTATRSQDESSEGKCDETNRHHENESSTKCPASVTPTQSQSSLSMLQDAYADLGDEQ